LTAYLRADKHEFVLLLTGAACYFTINFWTACAARLTCYERSWLVRLPRCVWDA